MAKQVVVDELPKCDFCEEPARYDSVVRAFGGPTWGYTCPHHWRVKAARPGKLGTGIGQRLVLEHEGGRVPDSEPLPKMSGM